MVKRALPKSHSHACVLVFSQQIVATKSILVATNDQTVWLCSGTFQRLVWWECSGNIAKSGCANAIERSRLADENARSEMSDSSALGICCAGACRFVRNRLAIGSGAAGEI
jgi:hypothetical protein